MVRFEQTKIVIEDDVIDCLDEATVGVDSNQGQAFGMTHACCSND